MITSHASFCLSKMQTIQRMCAHTVLVSAALLFTTAEQVQADVIVNITNDGSGGVLFEWTGQVDSLAGLTTGGGGFSPNQIGPGAGGYFFVGDQSFGDTGLGYSGFSGTLNQPSFSADGLIDGPSNDPQVGAFDGRIYLPNNYVLGTQFSGTAFDIDVEVTTFTNSLVTWDGGNESFQININSIPEPTSTSAMFVIALIGLARRRRQR